MAKKAQKTEEDHLAETRKTLVAAALAHVPFDGWSDAAFDAALADSGLNEALARLSCPRGALDLALTYHRLGDAAMVARAAKADLQSLRYTERVTALVRFRLEAENDREIVRRGVTFFAMPTHGVDGAAAIWQTCNLIWSTLGDNSDDLNWYSKRAILSAVYSSTLLFWLGDESDNRRETWSFLDRRMANVMQFEKLKSSIKDNTFAQSLMRGPGKFLDRIKAPDRTINPDLPGYHAKKTRGLR